MYAVALLFLLILHLYIKFERRRAKKFDFDPSPENNNGAEPNGTQPSTDLHREEASNVSRTGDQNIWRRTFNTNVSASTFRHPVNRRGEYMYAYGAPGVNFFLRAGAIGTKFTLCENKTRLSLHFSSVMTCVGVWFLDARVHGSHSCLSPKWVVDHSSDHNHWVETQGQISVRSGCRYQLQVVTLLARTALKNIWRVGRKRQANEHHTNSVPF